MHATARLLTYLSTILRILRAGVRPVPLEIHIQGFDIHNFEARMQVRESLKPVCRGGTLRPVCR
jgi:hypothetical protein